MSLINAARLDPDTAWNVYEEFEQFLADGPPYRGSPNWAVLEERDRRTLLALYEQSRSVY